MASCRTQESKKKARRSYSVLPIFVFLSCPIRPIFVRAILEVKRLPMTASLPVS